MFPRSFEHREKKKSAEKYVPRPIMACVGSRDFDVFATAKKLAPLNTVVDYYASPESLRDSGFKHGGPNSHVISAIDSTNKLSESYRQCNGVAAVGKDRKTGEDISFLSHQAVDIVLFGGNYYTDKNGNPDSYGKDYGDAIELLGSIIRKETGIDPHVVIGPDSVGTQNVRVVFDTPNRRLYIERPEQDGVFIEGQDAGGFPASKVREREATWLKGKK